MCCFIEKLFFQNLKYVFLRMFVCLFALFVVMMDKVPWLWFTKALQHGLKSPGEQIADKGSS